jgi:hypothetical protein
LPYRFQHLNLTPRLLVSPSAIAFRLETLDRAPLCDSCRPPVVAVTADTVSLLTEALRLHDALTVTRLESANRLAAIRAALGAAAEGEADPLGYLRDQLADETVNPGRGAAVDRP